jgi:hypothetical protein
VKESSSDDDCMQVDGYGEHADGGGGALQLGSVLYIYIFLCLEDLSI